MSNIKYQRFIKGKTDSHNPKDSCYQKKETCEMKQEIELYVCRLATGVLILILSQYLEYIQFVDWYILFTSITVVIIKFINGVLIIKNKVVDDPSNQEFFNGVFRFLPLEIVFAFCDSLKYIQIIYIAKWVNRRYLITYCSFFYIVLGFIDGWSKALFFLWIRTN